MIECYFRECHYHKKEEPFCTLFQCKATPNEIVELTQMRKEYLESFGRKNVDGSYE